MRDKDDRTAVTLVVLLKGCQILATQQSRCYCSQALLSELCLAFATSSANTLMDSSMTHLPSVLRFNRIVHDRKQIDTKTQLLIPLFDLLAKKIEDKDGNKARVVTTTSSRTATSLA
eukprot:m.18659 g.18659  ORF g.18659 m.18659 type:complete len:117 (+) comp10844_c0_seq2:463-813(+)